MVVLMHQIISSAHIDVNVRRDRHRVDGAQHEAINLSFTLFLLPRISLATISTSSVFV
jgi:hypothetical protein